jgi:hypothetical protein
MSQQRPGSATGAIWLLVGVVGLAGLMALLTAVFEGELVDAWARGRTDAGSVEPPAFVPVAVTMFVVVAALTAVLLTFFRHGHGWARVLLTVVVVMMAIGSLAAVRTSPPAVFLVLSLASLVVDVAAIVALWHRDTRGFTAAAPATADPSGSARP